MRGYDDHDQRAGETLAEATAKVAGTSRSFVPLLQPPGWMVLFVDTRVLDLASSAENGGSTTPSTRHDRTNRDRRSCVGILYSRRVRTSLRRRVATVACSECGGEIGLDLSALGFRTSALVLAQVVEHFAHLANVDIHKRIAYLQLHVLDLPPHVNHVRRVIFCSLCSVTLSREADRNVRVSAFARLDSHHHRRRELVRRHPFGCARLEDVHRVPPASALHMPVQVRAVLVEEDARGKVRGALQIPHIHRRYAPFVIPPAIGVEHVVGELLDSPQPQQRLDTVCQGGHIVVGPRRSI
mmetsp:Transcript_15591/g.47625  ORF Transcript_15591/g.47625 Transcript_15591/m.47625 type:complete len:297 (-) Transcript_15591:246-1136(-)